MTSPPNPQHEPTMEEILASIRKIISEDQGDPARAQPQQAAQAAAAPAEDMAAPVFELTQEVRDDGSIVEHEEPAPQPAPYAHNGGANGNGYESAETARPQNAEMGHDDLISDNARAAVAKVFDTLDQQTYQPEQVEAPMQTNGSVEAVFERAVATAFQPALHDWVDARGNAIMEQLKPLIRQWMDDNLPSLIENAVRNEIARAVRNRGR